MRLFGSLDAAHRQQAGHGRGQRHFQREALHQFRFGTGEGPSALFTTHHATS